MVDPAIVVEQPGSNLVRVRGRPVVLAGAGHQGLGRLTDRFGSSNETYDYDALGNLLTSHDATLSYPGLGASRPHGATHLATDEGEDSVITYDDVGNVESMGALSIAYNQLNLPS